jgi:hypothetical protein
MICTTGSTLVLQGTGTAVRWSLEGNRVLTYKFSTTVYSCYYGQNTMGPLGNICIILDLPPSTTYRPCGYGCSASSTYGSTYLASHRSNDAGDVRVIVIF